jgi:hypothetical protein
MTPSHSASLGTSVPKRSIRRPKVEAIFRSVRAGLHALPGPSVDPQSRRGVPATETGAYRGHYQVSCATAGPCWSVFGVIGFLDVLRANAD